MGKVLDEDVILIDGVATHNFVDIDFVRKKKMKTEKFAGFSVAIVKGDITPCNKVVKQVEFIIGDYKGTSNFYVFPTGGLPHGAWGTMIL